MIEFTQALRKEFNPDEPRDERGRWTSAGETAALKLRIQGLGAGTSDMRKALAVLPQAHLDQLKDRTSFFTGKRSPTEFELGKTTLKQRGGIELMVFDTYKTPWGEKKNNDRYGVTFHEVGHALDMANGWALSRQFAGLVRSDAAENMTKAQRNAAAYFLNDPAESFAELYRATYYPEGNAFGLKADSAQTVFKKSISELRDKLG